MTVRLRTPRLELIPLDASDLDGFHALSIEPGVRRFLWDDEIISRERAREALEANERLWAERAYGLFAVRELDAEPLVGYVGLWDMPGHPSAELLYALGAACWHRGYATEASLAVMRDAASRLAFAEFAASTDVPNEASIRVMRRLGMTPAGRDVIGGRETVFFRIAATDVPAAPASGDRGIVRGSS